MTPRDPDWIVDEASEESFPASDPPAWGSSHAAPSASTVGAPALASRRRHTGWIVALAVFAIVMAVRRRSRARARATMRA